MKGLSEDDSFTRTIRILLGVSGLLRVKRGLSVAKRYIRRDLSHSFLTDALAGGRAGSFELAL